MSDIDDNLLIEDWICPICLRRGTALIGWIGCRYECGHLSPADSGDLAEKRRKYLGLSRKEMARACGVSRRTVGNYELLGASGRYLDRTRELVEQAKSGHGLPTAAEMAYACGRVARLGQ